MSLFCRHNYQLIDKEIIEPLMKTLKTAKVSTQSELRSLTITKVIYFFKCQKCKRIKRQIITS